MPQHSENEKALFAGRVRAFEKRLQENMGDVYCPVHLSLGHESVAAEIWAEIRQEDWLFSTHRNHHHYLAKGGDEQKLFDEIMGLETGVNRGFAGSQGISDGSINFHASAIVGGLVGVATGTAYALKLDGANAIVVCCLGDAGTEAGVFWESLNFAVLHHLPIAFIVENNGMSVDSPIEERQAMSISSKARGFGVTLARSARIAMEFARLGMPSLYEAKVRLECNHIDMGTLAVKIA